MRLQLSIKAELENVTDLVPTDGFEYFFQVKCNSCHEIHPNFITVNQYEEKDMSNTRGTANFVWTCKVCKRESSAKFEPVPPKPYTADDSGQFAPLVVLDCRGLEFVGFDPRGIWQCAGAESRTRFNEVDLTEGDWTDYDEKAAQPVGIMEIESKWARAP